MALDRRTRERLREFCLEIHDDDGVDPATYFRKKRQPTKQDHKTRQLCRQVMETLSLAIGNSGHDERLLDWSVVSVDPAPDASQFMVTLALNPGVPWEQRADWESLIAIHAPRLRCEVAAAITRKKVPKLVFRIVASGQQEETQR